MEAEKTAEVTWKVVGYTEKVFQAAPGEPYRAGGCCEKCGQGIRYVARVKSSEGQEMEVGLDCCETMVGGEELRELRRQERLYEQEQYRKSPEYAARKERERKEEEERLARAAVAEEMFAMSLAGYRAIAACRGVHPAMVKTAMTRIQSLTAGRVSYDEFDSDEDFSWAAAYETSQLPPSVPSGLGIGQKFEAEALLVAFIPFETQYGVSYVQKYRLRSGALLVWFSKGGSVGSRHVGTWVKMKGTVKGHETRDGEFQTIVTRCKVTA